MLQLKKVLSQKARHRSDIDPATGAAVLTNFLNMEENIRHNYLILNKGNVISLFVRCNFFICKIQFLYL